MTSIPPSLPRPYPIPETVINPPNPPIEDWPATEPFGD